MNEELVKKFYAGDEESAKDIIRATMKAASDLRWAITTRHVSEKEQRKLAMACLTVLEPIEIANKLIERSK